MPKMSQLQAQAEKQARTDAIRTSRKTDRAARKTGEASYRADGMTNLFTAMGTIKDRSRHTHFSPNGVIGWQTLENMYRGDGIVRKIVDKYTEEMTRKGYEIDGDTDGEMYSLMESKGLNAAVREALRWSRLFGGALGVVVINDGSKDLKKPLNVNRIQSVDSMSEWNRWRTWWSISDAYTDPLNPKFMTPSKYTVIPILGSPFDVHETRTVRMDGLPVTDRVRVENLGWGDSIIQAVWEQLRQMATVYNGTERIVDNFVQEVLGIKNFASMLMTDEGTATIKKRLELLDLSSSNYHTRLLDADLETFTKSASTVTGLSDLMDRFGQMLSAVTKMPQTILFGKSEGGLNKNGESTTRAWYDDLAGDQQTILKPVYTHLINLIIQSAEYTGPVKLNPRLNFVPLWQMDEVQDAERRFQIAQADNLYHGLGLTPGEIIQSRFGGDHYSMETHLDAKIKPEDRIAAPVPNPEPPVKGKSKSKKEQPDDPDQSQSETDPAQPG